MTADDAQGAAGSPATLDLIKDFSFHSGFKKPSSVFCYKTIVLRLLCIPPEVNTEAQTARRGQ